MERNFPDGRREVVCDAPMVEDLIARLLLKSVSGTNLRQHDEAHEEGHHGHCQDEELPAVFTAECGRIHVHHCRHQALHTDKLIRRETKHAQKDDHNEEEAGPEGGERHHGHSSGIGYEGQTWTWVRGKASSLYLWVGQSSQVRVEVEVDSPGGSWQGDPSDQQDH